MVNWFPWIRPRSSVGRVGYIFEIPESVRQQSDTGFLQAGELLFLDNCLAIGVALVA